MGRSSSRLSRRGSHRGSQAHISPPDSRIRVVARFRPILDDAESCIEKISEQFVQIVGLNQEFHFDRVFDSSSSQQDVFDEAVRPTVEGVLEGYNGSVLAYGQTGAGKSHTMMGSPEETERGAIPRMIEYLFARKPTDFRISVGYLEIYNEKVRDLQCSDHPGDDLRVHEVSGGGGFYVKGLTETEVSSATEVYQIMRQGSQNRSTAATNMNSHSSRSHSVFIVDVFGPHTRSKLVLVDLAGSEKVAKSGARGTLLEEAVNINKSLSSLGMVVNALALAADIASESPPPSSVSSPGPNSTSGSSNGNQNSGLKHIPFRDSKLTRILQDSLAGNSRTCLIVHCSPSMTHISETVSTLRFGARAKHVKTVPRMNFTPGDSQGPNSALIAAYSQLQSEHSKLQHDLLLSRRDLAKALKDENTRLITLNSRGLHEMSLRERRIDELEQELQEENTRLRKNEACLYEQIDLLEPRINFLHPK